MSLSFNYPYMFWILVWERILLFDWFCCCFPPSLWCCSPFSLCCGCFWILSSGHTLKGYRASQPWDAVGAAADPTVNEWARSLSSCVFRPLWGRSLRPQAAFARVSTFRLVGQVGRPYCPPRFWHLAWRWWPHFMWSILSPCWPVQARPRRLSRTQNTLKTCLMNE